jgi:putative transposase
MVPRDWWLEDWEKGAIVDYHDRHPLEGYRRLTFMMLDDDVVAVSPASVYRVLKQANRLDRRQFSPSKKGTGFVQPLVAHEHWHVDVSYINVSGTFYYLTSVLDGCSRYIVHWEIRESMTERDVETIVQRALERHPGEKPRIISDNGPQFIARDFKEFIRLTGVTHVRTSPYYPQSNGKLERWHGSLKRECVRPAAVFSFDEARCRISSHVDY